MNGTINKVILIGHLGDDVKMHFFEGGNSIGRFRLATNDSYVNKQTGERVVNTEWHNVVVRNKLAEIFQKYAKKGDKVYLEGRLRTRKWTGEDGRDRYTTEVHVTEFTFLTPKPKDKQNTNATTGTEQSNQQEQNVAGHDNAASQDATVQVEPPETDVPKDDLPF